MADQSHSWPRWMEREIALGLAELVVLNLDGTPARELITTTVRVWAKAIACRSAWDESVDAPRFQEAFTRLARESTRWPSPAHFLNVIPHRASLLALTRQVDHDQAQRHLADLFRAMRERGCPIDDGSLERRLTGQDGGK